MKYINTKTGAVIDVESKISGGNWQVLEPATPPCTSTVKKEGEKDAVRNSRRRKKSVENIDTI